MMISGNDLNGTIIKSYIACKRQGWIASRAMSPLLQNKHIEMGSIYANNREKSSRKVGGIEIDELVGGSHFIVKEYKKTFSNIEASKMQLLFYMYTLKKELNLKKIEGYVISEETSEKAYLPLDKAAEIMVENMTSEILAMVNNPLAPKFVQTGLCLHCGHNFYCL